jgi:hypothetical protein
VAEVPTSSVFRAGLVSAVALFGLAWLTDTYLFAHQASNVGGIGALVRDYPWVFALGVFVVCALTTSQSTATRALVPIALGAGVARGSGCFQLRRGSAIPRSGASCRTPVFAAHCTVSMKRCRCSVWWKSGVRTWRRRRPDRR